MKKMAAQVNFFCFLKFFSVWLAIWRLKISTFVLIKVLLTYLLKPVSMPFSVKGYGQGMDSFEDGGMKRMKLFKLCGDRHKLPTSGGSN